MRETPGQRSATAFDGTVGATLDGLCACGCGQRLAVSSTSGWWATERCQARWQARQVGVEPQLPPSLAGTDGTGRVFMAPVGTEPDANGWTEVGTTTGDYVTAWRDAIRQLVEATGIPQEMAAGPADHSSAAAFAAMRGPLPAPWGITVHESPLVPEGTAYLFNPSAFRQHAPGLEMNAVVIKGIGPTPPRRSWWRRALRWTTPKVKTSGQWVRGRPGAVDYGNRGGDVVIEVFGRWLRLALYVGSPPGSHIGFWRTRVDTMWGINLRIGRRYIGPCLTMFVHTRPLRRSQ